MCTAITLNTDGFYFGRNLDLDYSFDEKVAITPRRYQFDLKNGDIFYNDYALIGMATVIDDYPLYAEAMNEKGLAMAGLNYPHHEMYPEPKGDKYCLAPYEFIPFVLGKASSLKEARALLEDILITNIPFKKELPITDLHWIIADKDGALVVEHYEDGLHIYDDPYGVLTNNPSFPYHLENIKNYMHLSASNAKDRFTNKELLEPYAEGMGAIGLPGDYSSASRFIKAAFGKLNVSTDGTGSSSVTEFFHILDSVAMIRGSVKVADGRDDITTYSCCMDVMKGRYYYKTYTNNQISVVDMYKYDLDAGKLKVYELQRKQAIYHHD